MRDLIDAGAVLALGSDWPVADAGPAARGSPPPQLRRVDGEPVVPAQALTAHEALAGYTLAPAYAAGEEGVAGRIRVGMRADLTGLAVDPVDAPAAELPENPVWLTVVDGMRRGALRRRRGQRERQRLGVGAGPQRVGRLDRAA